MAKDSVPADTEAKARYWREFYVTALVRESRWADDPSRTANQSRQPRPSVPVSG